MFMALFERRLKAQIDHKHQVKFAKVCKIIIEPLRRVLRADPLLAGDPRDLFEWWVSRQQFSPTQQKNLRSAHYAMECMGWLKEDALETKTFIKLEVMLKRAFKSRAITCMSDIWNIMIAPSVQRAAEIVGHALQPGKYATLPGAPNLDLVWLKGGTSLVLGEMIYGYVPSHPYAIGTDGVMWDGSHTTAQLLNVDVFREFMPPAVRLLYVSRRHEAKSRVNIGHRHAPRWVTFKTSLDGTLFTGQPDVSLSNTLLRLSVDVYAALTSQ
jgi:hypothetical protein